MRDQDRRLTIAEVIRRDAANPGGAVGGASEGANARRRQTIENLPVRRRARCPRLSVVAIAGRRRSQSAWPTITATPPRRRSAATTRWGRRRTSTRWAAWPTNCSAAPRPSCPTNHSSWRPCTCATLYRRLASDARKWVRSVPLCCFGCLRSTRLGASPPRRRRWLTARPCACRCRRGRLRKMQFYMNQLYLARYSVCVVAADGRNAGSQRYLTMNSIVPAEVLRAETIPPEGEKKSAGASSQFVAAIEPSRPAQVNEDDDLVPGCIAAARRPLPNPGQTRPRRNGRSIPSPRRRPGTRSRHQDALHLLGGRFG